MSYAAIFEVTRALRTLLHSQLVHSTPTAMVTLLPPGDTLPEAAGVNLYLYRVMESKFTRNRQWPGDRTTPPREEVALGLQLSYLLTPLGPKPDEQNFTEGDVAHTMLGLAMLTLHEHPVLNDIHLPDFDADTVLPPYLINSYERIKIYLEPTSIEELSKIWATINKPYRLSVAYEVSLVELTPTAPLPSGGGIVTFTNVGVITLDPPRLTTLTPAGGPLVSIDGAGVVTPNTVQIAGFGFSFPGQAPLARVGGRPVTISATPPPAGQALVVRLPVDLDAGPLADVQVTLNGRTSIPLTFAISPWLAGIRPVRQAIVPGSPAASRQLILSGSGFTLAPQTVWFAGPAAPVSAPAVAVDDTEARTTIPDSLPNGTYDVRIAINAAGDGSNARLFEVIPFVQDPPAVAVVGGAHRITLDGARLNGADVRLLIDGIHHLAGSNPNATQLVYTLGRLLSQGTHTIAVSVDGHLSHTLELEI